MSVPGVSNLKSSIFLLLFCLWVGACSENSNPQLGQLNFTATGEKSAQPAFTKGLLLLHSFEFDDAADQFRLAKEIDPNFVMAYWGEAMTYNHPLWRFQDKDAALETLSNLAPDEEQRIHLAATEIEKDFMRAIHVLYGEGTKPERDKKYAEFMGKLYNKYPGNDEVASFYSLSLIGSVVSGRDDATFEKAAVVAKEVLERNPKHPGALHYLIHAYDDPVNASKAISTADTYSKVAPSAGHALHMPSHIYLALGHWEKVVNSNIDSWGASYHRKESRDLNNDEYDYHSFHWLLYGYLQVDQPEEAHKILEDMFQYCEALPSERARSHKILLRSTYIIETEDYSHTGLDSPVEMKDLNVVLRAMDHYVKANRAFVQQEENSLAEIIDAMRKDRYFSEQFVKEGNLTMCGGYNRAIPNEHDIKQSEVMELAAQALLAKLQGKTESAYEYLQQAVEIESNISYAYGPPTIVKPTAELLADWYLEDNQPDKALEYYDLSLVMAPGRRLSEIGKANASRLL